MDRWMDGILYPLSFYAFVEIGLLFSFFFILAAYFIQVVHPLPLADESASQVTPLLL